MKIKAIIPCAGFGTRLGMAPNESKEMLWDNVLNERVIDYSLNLCKKLGFEPIVINRSDKSDLRNYLGDKTGQWIVNDSIEWYDSILKSYEVWGDNNVVLLPDTRWDNAEQSLKHVKYCFEKLNSIMVLGTLTVPDATKWCVVSGDYLFEKPKSNMSSLAVGVFGFSKCEGKKLFESFKKKYPFQIPSTTQFVELENFQDITREKSDRLVKV